MQDFPHHYRVAATAGAEGEVRVTAEGLEPILSAPPKEFDGPGDRWSPEGLLVAAVADCLVLTFRSVARHSRFEWQSLDCTVEGTLDKSDGRVRFTGFLIHAHMVIPAGGDTEKAERLLEKAESHCLISASLSGEVTLKTTVTTE
ncbi:hypothetical protein Maes01_02501 [Microbulbifer aestuariivivens]|uniref:OsmC family peroxiredoxin n=1 Tax=Microbulbifer aestuariivivens TaxID=1908308 RepID=A0ABP9WS88_9GAMM